MQDRVFQDLGLLCKLKKSTKTKNGEIKHEQNIKHKRQRNQTNYLTSNNKLNTLTTLINI